MQKYIGAKFIIPKRFKIQPYNYYINVEEVKKLKNLADCPICLDSLIQEAETKVVKEEKVISNHDNQIKNIESNDNSSNNKNNNTYKLELSERNTEQNISVSMRDADSVPRHVISLNNSNINSNNIDSQNNNQYTNIRNTISSSTNNLNLETSIENIDEDILPYKSELFNIKNCKERLNKKINDYIENLRFKYNKTPYMKSPCSHVFHSACMEMWMDKKNECPYCRMKIPALE